MDINTIKAIASDPKQKQAVTDLLIIDDASGYVNAAGKFISGYYTASTMRHALKTETVGLSKETEDKISTAGVNVLKLQAGLKSRLSTAALSTYQRLRDSLTVAERKTDLASALSALGKDTSLKADEKVAIKDLLIIDDASGYVNSQSKFISGYYTASTMKFALQTDTLGLSKEIEDKISKAGVNVLKLQAELKGRLSKDGLAVYAWLRDSMSAVESKADLMAALCRLNSAEAFCPVVSSVTITGTNLKEVKQGQTVTLTIEGKGFPAGSKVEFLTGKTPDSKIVVKGPITRSADGTKLTLTIEVAKDANATDDAKTADIKENFRTIHVFSKEFPQLGASLVDAFKVSPADGGVCSTQKDVLKVSDPNIEKGQSKVVTIKLECSDKKFPANPKVVVDPAADVTVSDVKRVDDKTVTAKITADPEAKEGTRKIIVTVEGPDGKSSDLTLPNGLNIVPPIEVKPKRLNFRERVARAADDLRDSVGPYHARDIMTMSLTVNGSSNAAKSEREKLTDPAAKPVAENNAPLLQANINLGSIDNPVPVLGGPLNLANIYAGSEKKGTYFTLGMGARARVGYNPNTVVGTEVGVNVNPAVVIKNGAFKMEGIFDYEFSLADQDSPSRQLLTGFSNEIRGGGSISSNFGKPGALLRARALYKYGWLQTMNKETDPFNYSAGKSALDLRFDLNLDFSRLTPGKAGGLALWLSTRVTPMGYMPIPITSTSGMIGTLHEDIAAWNLEGTVQLKDVAGKPWINLRGGEYQQKHERHMPTFGTSIGFETKKAGAFRLDYDWLNNPTLYTGKGAMHSVRTTWDLPWMKELLFLGVQINKLGNRTFGGIFAGINLLKFFEKKTPSTSVRTVSERPAPEPARPVPTTVVFKDADRAAYLKESCEKTAKGDKDKCVRTCEPNKTKEAIDTCVSGYKLP